MTNNQWDPNQASAANRWILRHVWAAPGGAYRLIAFTCFVCMGVVAAINWWVQNDPNALQSDRDFFPFITIFFGVIGGISLVLALVAWLKSKRGR